MRRFLVSAVVACGLIAAALLAPGGASATPLAPAGLRPAIDSLDPVDTVRCWRRGHWRWNHCYRYRVLPRAYYPYSYYVPPAVYYAPRPHWRWRYWRRR